MSGMRRNPFDGLLSPDQQVTLASALRKAKEMHQAGVMVIELSTGGWPRRVTWAPYELIFPASWELSARPDPKLPNG